jgi:hypothetical protein
MVKAATIVAISIGLLASGAARAQTVLPRAGWVASASSSSSGDVPANALDGAPNTRWSTGIGQTTGQWFSVDMITAQTFSQVTVDVASSSSDFPRGYQVFVSNDAVTWGDPVASGTGGPGVLTIAFPTQTARFVGIVQTGKASNWWSIAEFNVYGPGAVPIVALVQSGWTATASATNGSDVPGNAIDGSLATRWSTGTPQVSGQSLQLDMATAQAMVGIKMDSGSSTSDFARGYQIFATNDTTNWGAAIASGTGTSSVISVSFPQTTDRFLKIVLTGSASNWWSIAELTVFGVGTFAPVAMVLPRVGWVATASASCSSDTPNLALDDNGSTRFSTCQPQTPGQTFQVDMQVPRSFSKITLDAGSSAGDFPRAFQVFVSSDGVNWATPIATGTGTAQIVGASFPTQTARFLRVVQTGSSSTNWWSIAELNVYGLPPVELLRQGWLATASSGSSSTAPGIDGAISTRWTTGTPQVNGQFYEIDMQAPHAFNQIILDAGSSNNDFPRAFQVFASNDPANFGAPVASGTGSSSIVSIGMPDLTARYILIVQTGSASNWWSIAELTVYASPTVVQIQNYLDQTFYATSAIASSFVSAAGEQIDCIPFAAQPSVQAWLGAGVAMPQTFPSPPALDPSMPPPNGASDMEFAGQLDVNGQPRSCAGGQVPKIRPTIAQIQAAGGLDAYKQALASQRHPMGSQDPAEQDCWLNTAPGDGSPIGSANAVDWEHGVGIQTSGWLPTGAPGFFGAHMQTPIYFPFIQATPNLQSTGPDHTNTQFWVQTAGCENWYNPPADLQSGNEAKNQCQTGAACTNCTGTACKQCAVQSLEITPFIKQGDTAPHLKIFFTTDGYFLRNCYVGDTCKGCPTFPINVTPPGQPPATENSDCFVALPGARYTANMALTVKNGSGAAQYGVPPNEVELAVWNGSAVGKPGWWIFVNQNLIGWYPPATFNWPDGTPGPLSNGPANYLQAGGEVFNTWPAGVHTDTAMVSDNAAAAGFEYAAYARNVQYLDSMEAAHDAALTYAVAPTSELDQSIPGLCGFESGTWTDASSAAGGYTVASSSVPPGAAGWGQYLYFGGGRVANEITPPCGHTGRACCPGNSCLDSGTGCDSTGHCVPCTQPPPPQQQVADQTIFDGNNCFGVSNIHTVGGPCDPGFQRATFQTTVVSSSSDTFCTPSWASANPADCSVNVEYVTPSDCTKGITCETKVFESIQPQPPGPQIIGDSTIFDGNNCGGVNNNHTVGRTCDPGYHRVKFMTTILSSSSDTSCTPNWASNDPTDCTVIVNYVTPADCFKGITCETKVIETNAPIGCP